ncbi:MAG TPA: hypothetical protein DDZ43_17450 [Hyphomonadaceae bacterium]|nr:hypothetical protein [Ponticaulis sp.]HBH89163.1 hypothetical protein [Hyphomonadaceae bacterium]HBJ94665.1 hypothetical protein [Hyphomonadaceae bacterium]
MRRFAWTGIRRRVVLEQPRFLTDEEYEARSDKDIENYANEDWYFEASRRDLINRTFLRPADSTYVTARWQFFVGMQFEFYWSALHAVEKYIKASLLLSGHEGAKKFGHKIQEGYEVLQSQLITGLLPDEFPAVLLNRIAPVIEATARKRLSCAGPKEFIDNLVSNGGIDARYALRSNTTATSDIYCLDLTVFMLRRLCDNLSDVSKQQHILDQPDICTIKSGLLEDICRQEGHRLWPYLSRVNYFLVPKPDLSVALRDFGWPAFSNSAIYNNIWENIESDKPMRRRVAKRLAQWALDNITLPPEARSDLVEVVRRK